MSRQRRRRTAHDTAFLEAIREAPEDNVPRLIYADWLSDQSDPVLIARGELIRVQVQLAGLAARDPRREALEARQANLLHRFRTRWWRNRSYCHAGEFVRGFIEALTFELRPFVSFSDRVAALHPVVFLVITGPGVLSELELEHLSNRRALESVRSLTLRDIDGAATSTLLRAPGLTRPAPQRPALRRPD